MNMAHEHLQYTGKAVSLLDEKPDTLPRINALSNYAVALCSSSCCCTCSACARATTQLSPNATTPSRK